MLLAKPGEAPTQRSRFLSRKQANDLWRSKSFTHGSLERELDRAELRNECQVTLRHAIQLRVEFLQLLERVTTNLSILIIVDLRPQFLEILKLRQ